MQSSYAQSAYSGRGSGGSSYTVDRLVTTVFRDLATNENMVSIFFLMPYSSLVRSDSINVHLKSILNFSIVFAHINTG